MSLQLKSTVNYIILSALIKIKFLKGGFCHDAIEEPFLVP